MKIFFFGLGSIGQRHAKILLENFDHEIFAFRTQKGDQQEPRLSTIKEIYSWGEVEAIKPDIAFITNPTFLHIDTAMRCVDMEMKLFIEKPVGSTVDRLDELIGEVNKRHLVSYVAYNLRFHPVINYLKEYLESRRIHHASVYNSSYLPDWRPGRAHLKSYSASAQQGGGVILELSHEFDYIDYLFGGIESIEGHFDKIADVTVDAEDFLDAGIKTPNTYVHLHLDFLSLHNERTIKIDCEDEFILADLIKNKIEFTRNDGSRVETFESGVNESYEKQINFFFDNINNTGMMNNLSEAGALFRKILEFKENSQKMLAI